MRIYMAPMEGITGYVYRRAYCRHFGQIDRYFMPFLSGRELNRRQLREILPENNRGLEVIPQILTNHAEAFLETAGMLRDYGYTEVNLNLGCPSGTVTAKGRGAGFLRYPEKLENFLDEIFGKSPLTVSVKTRIGYESEEEWPGILAILLRYPFTEMIIHPRLRSDFYRSGVRPEAYGLAARETAAGGMELPLCYNGDIYTVSDCQTLSGRFPGVDRIMLGRGLIANPGLAGELKGMKSMSAEQLHGFLQEILEGYLRDIPEEKNVLAKLLELWTYLSGSFPESDRLLRRIRKAKRLDEYEIITEEALAAIRA